MEELYITIEKAIMKRRRTNAHWSRGGQQLISNYPELKIVSKDLGRSSDKDLREKNWDICVSGSYDLKD